MTSSIDFPNLEGWEPTRDTLSLYAQVVGALPRALAEPHPKWWHVSLKVGPEGLKTDNMPFPGKEGVALRGLMDLRAHRIEIGTSEGQAVGFDMQEGLSAAALGERVIAALADWGISAEFDRSKFEDADPRQYDPSAAAGYHAAILGVDSVLKTHKANLSGETGPVQLWPHHFDLAFEWYGTRMIPYEEHGKVEQYPSQINFGFSPGDGSHPAPYFYSNPWPFEASLTEAPLPSGARWFTESWEGSLLPYAALVGNPDAEQQLLDYFQTVYDLASPLLVA